MSIGHRKDYRPPKTPIAAAPYSDRQTKTWWLIALLVAAGVSFLTLLVMRRNEPAPIPVSLVTASLHPPTAAPTALPVTFGPDLPEQSLPRGLDVLGKLVASGSGTYMARSAGQSNSLGDALHRAFAMPSFDALATRTDAEGLFEASAWVQACSRLNVPTTDARCNDVRLHDPAYGDRLQLNAVAAGQPGAVVDWIQRHRDTWTETPLPGGAEMVSDRLLTMVAHGDFGAIQTLYYFCAAPRACQDGRLVQYVLGALWMKNHPDSLPQPQIPQEEAAVFRQAVARADELSRSLPAWNPLDSMDQAGRS